MKTKPRMLAPSECNTKAKIQMLNLPYVAKSGTSIIVYSQGVAICNETEAINLSMADMRKFARWFLRKQRCT